MKKIINKILKLPLTLPLRMPFVRKRAAFHFRQDYFADLEISIPLGHDFWCPVSTHDAIHSFSEIFVAGEYGSFLEEIPLPSRWIDLGCHAGYFSLYLAWRHAIAAGSQDWRALLVDADPRMESLARRTLDRNNLSRSYQFLSGLISSKECGQDFALREGMVSSTDIRMDGIQSVQKVGVIRPLDILEALPPPYDLIKIDIEGGEMDFLESYKDVYTNASAVVMEWHSPDRDGSAALSLRKTLEAAGFQFVKNLRSIRALQVEFAWFSSGVQLYRRNAGV